jgi:hypothetical protein
MKKNLPVLLISLIFLNTFGFNLLVDYLLFQCKRDFSAEKFYDLDKMIVLKVTGDEKIKLQRIDEDEIKYEGKMYDIFKEINRNGVLYIYCINDKKEDRLFELLFKVNKNDEPANQSVPAITKNLIKNYILAKGENLNLEHELKIIFFNTTANYNSPIKKIVLPPPESFNKTSCVSSVS